MHTNVAHHLSQISIFQHLLTPYSALMPFFIKSSSPVCISDSSTKMSRVIFHTSS